MEEPRSLIKALRNTIKLQTLLARDLSYSSSGGQVTLEDGDMAGGLDRV